MVKVIGRVHVDEQYASEVSLSFVSDSNALHLKNRKILQYLQRSVLDLGTEK